MKEFNLKEAKAGKPVCREDGAPARIVCFDREHDTYNLVVLVKDAEFGESVFVYTDTGEILSGVPVEGRDLVMKDDEPSIKTIEFHVCTKDDLYGGNFLCCNEKSPLYKHVLKIVHFNSFYTYNIDDILTKDLSETELPEEEQTVLCKDLITEKIITISLKMFLEDFVKLK